MGKGNVSGKAGQFTQITALIDLSRFSKLALMSQMLEEIAHIVDITAEDVWIYLQYISATQMIEFGRFLPAPGEEVEWEKRMTPEKHARLPRQPH